MIYCLFVCLKQLYFGLVVYLFEAMSGKPIGSGEPLAHTVRIPLKLWQILYKALSHFTFYVKLQYVIVSHFSLFLLFLLVLERRYYCSDNFYETNMFIELRYYYLCRWRLLMFVSVSVVQRVRGSLPL